MRSSRVPDSFYLIFSSFSGTTLPHCWELRCGRDTFDTAITAFHFYSVRIIWLRSVACPFLNGTPAGSPIVRVAFGFRGVLFLGFARPCLDLDDADFVSAEEPLFWCCSCRVFFPSCVTSFKDSLSGHVLGDQRPTLIMLFVWLFWSRWAVGFRLR